MNPHISLSLQAWSGWVWKNEKVPDRWDHIRSGLLTDTDYTVVHFCDEKCVAKKLKQLRVQVEEERKEQAKVVFST